MTTLAQIGKKIIAAAEKGKDLNKVNLGKFGSKIKARRDRLAKEVKELLILILKEKKWVTLLDKDIWGQEKQRITKKVGKLRKESELGLCNRKRHTVSSAINNRHIQGV